MSLSPEQKVIAAAIDVVASLSAGRYRTLLTDALQGQPLVGRLALRRLAEALDAWRPGIVAKVRDENEKWRAEQRQRVSQP